MNSDLIRPGCAKARGARVIVTSKAIKARKLLFTDIGSEARLRGKEIAEAPIFAVEGVVGGAVQAVRLENGRGPCLGRGHGADSIAGRSKRPGGERAENCSAERRSLLAGMND